MKRFNYLVACLFAVALWGIAPRSYACNGGPDVFVTNVSRTFSAGSAWSVDIYRSPCEGLVLRGASFKPAGGVSTLVLHRASIAEVHVPYDNNAARFLDVTVDTSGLGVSAIPLAAAECDGTRFDGNRICVQNEDGGYGWKFNGSFRTKQRIQVFLASQLGQYTYINQWTFSDDGAIEPEIGLTGRLQLFSGSAANAEFGSPLNNPANPLQIGLNHMHNFYYRLDFDINGAGGDRVSRMSYSPFISAGTCANSGACGKTLYTQIATETSQTWSTTGQTSWLVQDTATVNADGRNIGYEIRPHLTGLWRGMVSAGEPWANAELWVTAFNSCELFAARNQAPYLDPGAGCGAPAANLSAMLTGQNVNSADLVVWYANRLHHVTRDEDQTNMPIEWASFHIEPRNFSASNPAP